MAFSAGVVEESAPCPNIGDGITNAAKQQTAAKTKAPGFLFILHLAFSTDLTIICANSQGSRAKMVHFLEHYADQSIDFTYVFADGLMGALVDERNLVRFGFFNALMPAMTNWAFTSAPAGVEWVRASPNRGATFSGPSNSNSRATISLRSMYAAWVAAAALAVHLTHCSRSLRTM